MRPGGSSATVAAVLAILGCRTEPVRGSSPAPEVLPDDRPAVVDEAAAEGGAPALAGGQPTPEPGSAERGSRGSAVRLPRAVGRIGPSPEERARARATLPRLLRWIGTGRVAVLYDRACRPMRVKRCDGYLHAVFNRRARVEGDTRTVHADELEITETIYRTDGFDETYRRGRDGRWVRAGMSACGCGNEVEGLLSRVTSDAAWFSSDHPVLFRTRAACSQYRRHHRIPPSDLPTW